MLDVLNQSFEVLEMKWIVRYKRLRMKPSGWNVSEIEGLEIIVLSEKSTPHLMIFFTLHGKHKPPFRAEYLILNFFWMA